MVMKDHICPYGLKAKHLLKSRGFAVDDRWLTTRAETDAFKAEHGVKTTPQTFIDGVRIGGYDDLRRHFGLKVADPRSEEHTSELQSLMRISYSVLFLTNKIKLTNTTDYDVTP